MKKTFLIIGVVALLLIVLIVVIKTKSNKSDYVVRVGYVPIMSPQLLLEIAIQNKFFEEQGLLVEKIPLQSSNQMVEALVRGDIDITPHISVLPYLSAEMIDPGKIKIVALTDITSDKLFDSLLVKSNSAIQTINDLKGKKIGVFPGSTATNFLKLFFKEKGIESFGMLFVQLPAEQHLTALSAGSIDALFTYEPTISIALTSGEAKKIYGSIYAEQVNHSPSGSALISTKFINNHPNEAEKVVKAFDKAFDYLRTNDADARKIVKNIFKLDQKVVDALSFTYFKNSNQIDNDAVEKFLEILVVSGELKSKPDLTNAFYKP